MRNKVLKFGLIIFIFFMFGLITMQTYAKYMKKVSGYDQAKVASFINDVSCLGQSITQDTNLSLFDEKIAPGSKGEFSNLLMTLENENGIPLSFSFQDQEYTDMTKLSNDINVLVNQTFSNISSKTDDKKQSIDIVIKWEWPFYISDEQDIKDTLLASKDAIVTLNIECTFIQKK